MKTTTVAILLLSFIASSYCIVHLPLKHKSTKTQLKTVLQKNSLRKSSANFVAQAPEQVPLNNHIFYYYFADILIGTPGQEFNLAIDTGSSNLWVFSSQCQLCNQQNKPTYNSSKSSTFQNVQQNGTDEQFVIYYGFGKNKTTADSDSGLVVSDDVTFAGLTAKNVIFAETTEPSADTLEAGFTGIIGVALRSLAFNNINPLFNELYDQGLIENESFSLWLNMDGGQLTLGGIDTTKNLTQFYYYAVTNLPVFLNNVYQRYQQGFWVVNLTDVIVINNNQNAIVQAVSVLTNPPPANQPEYLAVFDSGTSMLTFPNQTYQNIMAQMPQNLIQQGAFVNCSDASQFPDLGFKFNNGDETFILTAQDYFIQASYYYPQVTDSSICTLQFYNKSVDDYTPILGATFFRKFQMHFDIANQQIGIALAKIPVSVAQK